MKSTTKLSLVFALLWPITLLAEVIDVNIYYVGETTGNGWAGVQQGATEANIQGEFLGQKYTIQPVTLEALKSVDDATAVIVNLPSKSILEVAQDPHFKQISVFNIASDDDALRQACLPNLLNLPVSQKMKQDALAQWEAKNPDVKVTAQGWHPSFRKFAAAQLNKRFTENHQVEMDDLAWAGWAAVKMLSDTVARTQTSDAAAIMDYIEHKLAFDGQKGDGATFRETGQLRQIVLLIDENNKIAAEAPLRGTKGGLDSLGLLSCK